jgi:hypothetical protein
VQTYPASRWSIGKSNWANFPTESLEPPAEQAYPTDPTWPYHFVDGLEFVAKNQPPQQLNPLSSLGGKPLVRDDNEWNARRGKLNQQNATGGFFGNAVEVSLELILNTNPKEFLDWDLDGDPGIGFPTWELSTPGTPRNQSQPEP